MANNRLLLIHKDSGLYVVIGKRLGSGWYVPGNVKRQLSSLFDATEDPYDEMDGFELLIEHNERVSDPVIRDDWTYSDADIKALKIPDPTP